MPLNEMYDYIKILNDAQEKEEQEIDEAKSASSSLKSNINDLKMAGNSLPGGIF